MVQGCYEMSLDVRDASVIVYETDQLNYESILANVSSELFYIVSNIFAQMANRLYESWYSFSYYVGDMGYRIFLANKLRLD